MLLRNASSSLDSIGSRVRLCVRFATTNQGHEEIWMSMSPVIAAFELLIKMKVEHLIHFAHNVSGGFEGRKILEKSSKGC